MIRFTVQIMWRLVTIAFILALVSMGTFAVRVASRSDQGVMAPEGNSDSDSKTVATNGGASGPAKDDGGDGSVIISNQKCLNKCVGRKENMCRWKWRNPNKKAACMQRCHKECLVCPLTAVKGTCANKCKRDCKLGKTPEGTPEGMRCVHSCLEACPCEDLSEELRDIIRLIPDSDMAIPFAVSSSKHFTKKKPAGSSPSPDVTPSASGPAEKPWPHA